MIWGKLKKKRTKEQIEKKERRQTHKLKRRKGQSGQIKKK